MQTETMTETVMPLNRRARRAMRFQERTPLAQALWKKMAETGATTWGPAGSHQKADPWAPRAGRRRVARDLAAGRMVGDPCCDIDYMPLAEQRRLMDRHDRDVIRTGRYHGAGCHFCS